MSDLNGTNFNFNVVNNTAFQSKVNESKGSVETPSENEQTLNEISTNHAEVIGRSMLTNDTLKNDLDAILSSPQIAENSDKLFEQAYAKLKDAGIDNPYEEAASFSTTSL